MKLSLATLTVTSMLNWVALCPASSQTQIDILDIYQRFFASRVAALGCQATSSATEQKFMANLMAITTRAAIAFKERNPSLSDADLVAKMNAIPVHIRTVIEGEIAKNGCSSPRIRELLVLYKLHSEMSF